MITHYLINKVQKEEIKVLQDISISTFSATYKSKNDPDNFKKHLEIAFNLEQLQMELESELCHFYFIRDGGKILGYIKLNMDEAQTEKMAEDYIELERIYVVKEFKGKGIGKRLITFASSKGKSLGYTKLWLGVWDQNPEAIAFYTKMGFKIIDTHIFTVGDEDQTDYVMEIDLT